MAPTPRSAAATVPGTVAGIQPLSGPSRSSGPVRVPGGEEVHAQSAPASRSTGRPVSPAIAVTEDGHRPVPRRGHGAEHAPEVDGTAPGRPGQGELHALRPLGHLPEAVAAASVPGRSWAFSQSTKVAASSVLAPH